MPSKRWKKYWLCATSPDKIMLCGGELVIPCGWLVEILVVVVVVLVIVVVVVVALVGVYDISVKNY